MSGGGTFNSTSASFPAPAISRHRDVDHGRVQLYAVRYNMARYCIAGSNRLDALRFHQMRLNGGQLARHIILHVDDPPLSEGRKFDVGSMSPCRAGANTGASNEKLALVRNIADASLLETQANWELADEGGASTVPVKTGAVTVSASSDGPHRKSMGHLRTAFINAKIGAVDTVYATLRLTI